MKTGETKNTQTGDRYLYIGDEGGFVVRLDEKEVIELKEVVDKLIKEIEEVMDGDE